MKRGLLVRLVAFQKTHAQNTLKWVNDPQLMLMVNRVKLVTETEHWQWYEKVVKDSFIFAIEVGGKHIGNCCLKDVNADGRSRKAELWIYIGDKKTRGKGYGEQAMRLLLDYAFNALNLNRIYLYSMAHNKPAYNLYRKLGFKHEGVRRQDVFINGKYCDTVFMGILKKEWAGAPH